MYCVYSKSLVTGKVNHGTHAFPKAEAQAFADELNADPNYKNYLVHWIEAAQQGVHLTPLAPRVEPDPLGMDIDEPWTESP